MLDSRSGEILGLVNRFIFFARYAQQYVPELFGRKSILKLANRAPLVVDADVRVADLGATLLVENPANNNRSEAWDIRLIKEG